MQLISITEPASIDVKKTMSTLGEVFESNQINNDNADIGKDVVAKISSNKNNIVLKAVEDIVTSDNINNEQTEDKVKDLNGIVKTNGDAQNEDKIPAVDNNKLNTESNATSENESEPNKQSNGNSSLSDSCKSSCNTPTNNISTVDKNTIFEESDAEERKKVTSDQEITNVSLNNNEATGDSIETSSAVVERQVDVFREKVSDDNKSKQKEISIENKDLTQNVSAFSPNSDTAEKEVNISAQLQQLEDDASLEENFSNSINNSKTTEIKSISQTQENEIQSQKENNDLDFIEEIKQNQKNVVDGHNQYNRTPKVNTEIPSLEDNDENIVLEKDFAPTDCVEDNSLITSFDGTLPIEKTTTVNHDISEAINKSDSHVDCAVKSSNQNYISVKKLTDMTYSVPHENNEATVVSDDIIDKRIEQRNQVMEIDIADPVITSESSITMVTSDELALTKKNTDVENNAETANKKTVKNTLENSTVSKVNEVTTIVLENNNSSVMEIDDVDEVSIVEKPSTGIAVDKDEIKNREETAKYTVINITDNDDEDDKNCAPERCEVNNDTSSIISIDDNVKVTLSEHERSSSEVEIMDIQKEESNPDKTVGKQLPVVCKLSNTMNILSDEEDEPVEQLSEKKKVANEESKKADQNKCINLDEDDDIMFIENTNSPNPKDNVTKPHEPSLTTESQTYIVDVKIDPDTGEKNIKLTETHDNEGHEINKKDSIPIEVDSQPKADETKPIDTTETKETKAPLITKSFLKSVTKNLADMTRNELEDFCILKLVESIVDKSNLNEIKTKMKTMAQAVEDLRKKALALTKQNRDLQVVVKTVQEDQKKRNTSPMMPMKITRSVGMQVVLSIGDKTALKKKIVAPAQPAPVTPAKPMRNVQSPKTQKPIITNIPVPRLVPATSPTVKPPASPVVTAIKPAVTVRNVTPQRPEKRPHSKLSPSTSVTVDLTDDEPPAKVNSKNPAPPVRLVPSQNLMAPKNRPQFGPTSNSPRKVYIPISSNNQNIRPGSAVIKNFVQAPRPRQPSVVRMQTVRLNQVSSTNRHPAPLPDAMKQYQPPTWKALPPAPDLKLSKVDNGIVISWKFEGYQPDTYEEVASFQLYAYQETSAPPSTALWKKIGDIKALPLPMACTLTQFMSGFKYYFAVRAIDVRSRIGPFSLPGSIMLISKS